MYMDEILYCHCLFIHKELEETRSKLKEIEKIAREAFSNPDTQDINLYRAQALAKIFQIFEYKGATIGEAKEADL